MSTTEPGSTIATTFRGDLVTPGSDDYDAARALWNGMVDRRPSVIARPTGVADVIAALDLADRERMPVSVRSGGHGVAGRALNDGGVVIDLAHLDHIRVDHAARLAHVGPAATWGELDRECQAFGLATTGGVHSGTGVGGLALGGGIGYLARAHGLTVDNIVAAEVVLADGRVAAADADRHPDLYWAVRGGGGNFGVVTELTLRLHEVGPQVMTAQAYVPMEGAADALRWYRDFQLSAPREVSVFALIVNVPPIDAFPVERHGTPALALVGCHAGDLETGSAALAPFDGLDGAFLSFVVPMDYADLQSAFDAGSPDGARYYWKAHYFEELDDRLLDVVAELACPLPGAWSMMFFEPLGGAIADVAADATAFPHRNARFGAGFCAGWDDSADDSEAIAWARRLHAATAEFSTGGMYGNYADRDDRDRVLSMYGRNLDRLQRVKAEYDPRNVFDQGIEPRR